MAHYDLPQHNEHRAGFVKRNAWWIIPLAVFDILFLFWWFRTPETPDSSTPPSGEPAAQTSPEPIPEPLPPPGLVYTYPTAQTALLDTNTPGVFMLTASGRPESAHYGSVRTSKQGKYILPSFHEGIDIAPMNRDRKNMPTDLIYAVADGRIAHINKYSGNSNYGKYIVMVHDDPIGEIYTLYAHLADINDSIRTGMTVTRGQTIGLLGNTASTGLPLVRAHLHFEIGLILNSRFDRWFRAQKLKPDHGIYHGHNLLGIAPLDMYRIQEAEGRFSMGAYLSELNPAFKMIVPGSRKLNYFERYPSLWSGPANGFKAMVLEISEGGAPTRGYPATDEDLGLLGKQRSHVLEVNDDVIGRNGLRLVVKRKGNWVLGRDGLRWLEMLTYH